MRIHADETMYHLNLKKVSEHLQAWYQAHKETMDTLTTSEGKTISFARKSLARLALNAALVPIGIPALKMLYGLKGAEIPHHDKHEDLLDYLSMSMIGFLAILDEGYLYVETLEGAGHDSRTVNSISTHEPVAIAAGSEGRTEEEEETLSPRGETYLYSGQNGYGENQVDQGDYQEEV